MENFEKTFDNAAADYDKSRPMYVKEIYEDIFNYQQINQDSHVLEIGMGTGKAAQPILDTYCHFVGIEPGEELAALAKEKFQKYANFSLYRQTLQDYICEDYSFDFIYAATAFHWIPEEYGYKRVYNLLKKGGVFARFAYHAGPDKGRNAAHGNDHHHHVAETAYDHRKRQRKPDSEHHLPAVRAKPLRYLQDRGIHRCQPRVRVPDNWQKAIDRQGYDRRPVADSCKRDQKAQQGDRRDGIDHIDDSQHHPCRLLMPADQDSSQDTEYPRTQHRRQRYSDMLQQTGYKKLPPVPKYL